MTAPEPVDVNYQAAKPLVPTFGPRDLPAGHVKDLADLAHDAATESDLVRTLRLDLADARKNRDKYRAHAAELIAETEQLRQQLQMARDDRDGVCAELTKRTAARQRCTLIHVGESELDAIKRLAKERDEARSQVKAMTAAAELDEERRVLSHDLKSARKQIVELSKEAAGLRRDLQIAHDDRDGVYAELQERIDARQRCTLIMVGESELDAINRLAKERDQAREQVKLLHVLPVAARPVTSRNPDVFRPGDVVRLRSGGPPLTLLAIDDTGRNAKCAWFGAGGAPYQMNVPTLSLRHHQDRHA